MFEAVQGDNGVKFHRNKATVLVVTWCHVLCRCHRSWWSLGRVWHDGSATLRCEAAGAWCAGGLRGRGSRYGKLRRVANWTEWRTSLVSWLRH